MLCYVGFECNFTCPFYYGFYEDTIDNEYK